MLYFKSMNIIITYFYDFCNYLLKFTKKKYIIKIYVTFLFKNYERNGFSPTYHSIMFTSLSLLRPLHFALSDGMKNFMLILFGIAVVLVIIVLLGSSKSKFKRGVSMFLAEDEEERRKYAHQAPPPRQKQQKVLSDGEAYYEYDNDNQKHSNSNQIEMATLIRKSDDRLRVIESTGQVRLMDEFYQLVFKSRKGRTIKVECSRQAYEQIPFNQQGSLTFRKNTFVKFKYIDGTIYNQ